MDALELANGHHVVLDVGHSGAVTGIVRCDDLIVTGGRDGFVYVRRTDGRSVVPPAHLPEITCIAMPPDIDVAVVGTVDRVFGVDLETGDDAPLAGFGGVGAVAAATVGDVVLVGCDDGSLRTVSADAGTTVLSVGTGVPVRAVASNGSRAAVSHLDGTVRLIEHDGTEHWSVSLHPAEVACLAVAADGTVLAAGSGGPSGGHDLSGIVLRLGASGDVESRMMLPGWVDAMTINEDTVVVALSDGNVHRIGAELQTSLGEDTHLGRYFAGVTWLSTIDGEVWVGTTRGQVSRIAPGLTLPSVPSGMFSLNVSGDERRAVATDGAQVVVWDLTTGEPIVTLAREDVRAVTFAGSDSKDVVLALLDGSLERRTGEGLLEVAVSAAPLADRPHTLGWLGPLVMAFAGEVADASTPADALLIDPDDLSTIRPNEDAFLDVTVMHRSGYWFAGTGELDGTHVAVIDREHLVVQRDRLVTATPGARPWIRIAEGSTFVG